MMEHRPSPSGAKFAGRRADGIVRGLTWALWVEGTRLPVKGDAL